jgi:hypothetical protein
LATLNSKASYQGKGDTPEPGSTQLWQLVEALLPLIKFEMDKLIDKFSAPVLVG